jgi:hypothetical protein
MAPDRRRLIDHVIAEGGSYVAAWRALAHDEPAAGGGGVPPA